MTSLLGTGARPNQARKPPSSDRIETKLFADPLHGICVKALPTQDIGSCRSAIKTMTQINFMPALAPTGHVRHTRKGMFTMAAVWARGILCANGPFTQAG
jgi:hypothetical protein